MRMMIQLGHQSVGEDELGSRNMEEQYEHDSGEHLLSPD